jgi:hypothetical protein
MVQRRWRRGDTLGKKEEKPLDREARIPIGPVEKFKNFLIPGYLRHLSARDGRRRNCSKRPSSKAASREEGEAYTGVR